MIKYKEDQEFNSNFDLPDDLTGFEFQGCKFHNIDLSEADLKNCLFIECTFTKCNLSNSTLLNSSLRDVRFNQSKLIGINWSDAKAVSDIKFNDSVLNLSSFNGRKMKKSEIINCKVDEVDFSESDFSQSNFSGSHLAGSSFNNANLEKCDFRNCQQYFINVKYTKIKGAKFSFPEAISLLNALEIKVEGI